MDLTPEEAGLAAPIDKDWEKMTWLEKDLVMARRHKVDGISQRQIARERGISPTMVNYAITVAEVLTPASIVLINQTLVNNPAGDAEGVHSANTPFDDPSNQAKSVHPSNTLSPDGQAGGVHSANTPFDDPSNQAKSVHPSNTPFDDPSNQAKSVHPPNTLSPAG